MSEAGGRVGTGKGAADQSGLPRRGGADRSGEADHPLMVRSACPRRYRSVDPGGQTSWMNAPRR